MIIRAQILLCSTGILVGYENTTYSLSKEDGLVEICVKLVNSTGLQTAFVVNVNTTTSNEGAGILHTITVCYNNNYDYFMADSTYFDQNITKLYFFNDTRDVSDRKCYSLRIDTDKYCEYFINGCNKTYLISQLTTESQHVTLVNAKVNISIENLDQCGRYNILLNLLYFKFMHLQKIMMVAQWFLDPPQ